MSYKQIKWLILIIPTVTIGIWEYVRHEFLLPYISMELGNWLAPVLVFLVTMTLLLKLFSMMEGMQEELKRERASKAALEERERIVRELHDGIAQSLFLLSVKVDQLEQTSETAAAGKASPYHSLRQRVHEVNEYVRQAIHNLRYPPVPHALQWMDMLQNLLDDFQQETNVKVHLNWELPEVKLASKEKVELLATIREALQNIRKHAEATEVWITGKEEHAGWLCTVEDNGQGFDGDPFLLPDRFGLNILQERAQEMGWELQLLRKDSMTCLLLRKEGAA